MHESVFGSLLIYTLLAIFHGYFMSVLSAFSFFAAIIYVLYLFLLLVFVYRKLNEEGKSKLW
jgi:hypothetical protein